MWSRVPAGQAWTLAAPMFDLELVSGGASWLGRPPGMSVTPTGADRHSAFRYFHSVKLPTVFPSGLTSYSNIPITVLSRAYFSDVVS